MAGYGLVFVVPSFIIFNIDTKCFRYLDIMFQRYDIWPTLYLRVRFKMAISFYLYINVIIYIHNTFKSRKQMPNHITKHTMLYTKEISRNPYYFFVGGEGFTLEGGGGQESDWL